MSTPNAANLLVGSGKVYFNRKEAAGTYKGYRELGNVSKCETTPEVEQIQKKSSMDAARGTLASAITGTKVGISLTMSEWDRHNLALALLGAVAVFTQTSSTSTDVALGAAKKGYALDTGKKNITVTAVKTGATVHVAGTDYTVDAAAGLVFVLETGAIAEDAALTWSGSVPAITAGVKVTMLTNGNIEGKLKFVSSADQSGPRLEADWPRVQFAPDGAVGFLSDDYADLGLKGEVLRDDTQATGEEFGTARYI